MLDRHDFFDPSGVPAAFKLRAEKSGHDLLGVLRPHRLGTQTQDIGGVVPARILSREGAVASGRSSARDFIGGDSATASGPVDHYPHVFVGSGDNALGD